LYIRTVSGELKVDVR